MYSHHLRWGLRTALLICNLIAVFQFLADLKEGSTVSASKSGALISEVDHVGNEFVAQHPMARVSNKAKLLKRENRRDVLKNFTRHFIHIAKTGGTYARQQLNVDVRGNRILKAGGGIVCDQGVSPVTNYQNWPEFFQRRNSNSKVKCNMYMTESHYSPVPDHVYTIVRDPMEHVVSQYFHCRESKTHGRHHGHLMPNTLDDWLVDWVDVRRQARSMNGKEDEGATPAYINVVGAYKCYNPINMQSRMLGYDPSDGIDPRTDLARRFDFVGLTSQMGISLCIIFLSWYGVVLERCKCPPNGSKNISDDKGGAKIAHVGRRHSHNVTNHGATHNHTAMQVQAIKELADDDMELYRAAESLFWEKVGEVEREHAIQLCE